MTTEESKNDKYYYGDMPHNIDEDSLQIILANGLKKLIETNGDIYSNDDLSDILDRWFEHDDNGDQRFSHIVSDDWEDERTAKWFNKTLKMARNK
jgi:hypothetical protein